MSSSSNNNEDTTGGNSRRDFLKVAGTAAAAVVAGGLAERAEAAQNAPQRVAAAGGGRTTAVAAGMKVAAGIPVPAADPNKLHLTAKIPQGAKMAPGRVLGANDRINVGFVGTGGQGGYHVRNFVDEAQARNVVPMAVSDVYRPHQDGNANYIKSKISGVTVQSEKDYRKLIDNPDIDAIVISTPEHWHAQVAIHAMQAGKHVYIEKPMTRYLDEAFQVYDTAMRTKKMVQVGSQGSSDVRWHAAGEAIRSGRIGKPVLGQGSYMRNNPRGEWNYGIPGDISPETLDWDMWLGSAPKRPFATTGGARDGEQPTRDDAAARFRRYRKYRDYSAGILGDLMPHKLHPFLIASGNPEFPSRVVCTGTKALSNDRDVADTVQVLAEFPSGWSMLFMGSTVTGYSIQDVFRGNKGTIFFGNAVEVRAESPFAEEVEGGAVATDTPTLSKYARYESVPEHEKDWLLSIRTGKTPNCNIDLATKVQTIVSLAEMSQLMNKAMLFDAKTRKITAG
jgi:predicted dehydrogenase